MDHEPHRNCQDCENIRKLLHQKHGECWSCAQTRHTRDRLRMAGRRREKINRKRSDSEQNPYELPPLELTTNE